MKSAAIVMALPYSIRGGPCALSAPHFLGTQDTLTSGRNPDGGDGGDFFLPFPTRAHVAGKRPWLDQAVG